MFATVVAATTTAALHIGDHDELRRTTATIPPCFNLSEKPVASCWVPGNSTDLDFCSSTTIYRYRPATNSVKELYTSSEPLGALITKSETTIVVGEGNKVHVLGYDSGVMKVQTTFDTHKSPVVDVSINSDASQLLSASESAVVVHETAAGTSISLRGASLNGHRISTSSFHPFTRTKALVGAGKNVLVYDTGRPSGPSMKIPLSGDIVALASSPFSKSLVAAATSDGFVTLLDLDKENAVIRNINLKTPLTKVAFSPEGGAIYAGTENGQLHIIQLRSLDRPPRVISVGTSRIETLSVQTKRQTSETTAKSVMDPIPRMSSEQRAALARRPAPSPARPSRPTISINTSPLAGKRPSANELAAGGSPSSKHHPTSLSGSQKRSSPMNSKMESADLAPNGDRYTTPTQSVLGKESDVRSIRRRPESLVVTGLSRQSSLGSTRSRARAPPVAMSADTNAENGSQSRATSPGPSHTAIDDVRPQDASSTPVDSPTGYRPLPNRFASLRPSAAELSPSFEPSETSSTMMSQMDSRVPGPSGDSTGDKQDRSNATRILKTRTDDVPRNANVRRRPEPLFVTALSRQSSLASTTPRTRTHVRPTSGELPAHIRSTGGGIRSRVTSPEPGHTADARPQNSTSSPINTPAEYRPFPTRVSSPRPSTAEPSPSSLEPSTSLQSRYRTELTQHSRPRPTSFDIARDSPRPRADSATTSHRAATILRPRSATTTAMENTSSRPTSSRTGRTGSSLAVSSRNTTPSPDSLDASPFTPIKPKCHGHFRQGSATQYNAPHDDRGMNLGAADKENMQILASKDEPLSSPGQARSPLRPTTIDSLQQVSSNPDFELPPDRPREALRSIIQDAMFDFERRTHADIEGLHLDLLRVGRSWKAELRLLMDEYVGDLRDLREENKRMKEELDRLRMRGY